MTGFSSNPSLIISALDLLIASSYNEPFGRVVVESMIQKTPVLACRSGGHVESIEHNNTGLLYDESDPNMLLSYMLRIISKDINTDFMVDAAYCNATLEYSSTMHADAIISIYRKLG